MKRLVLVFGILSGVSACASEKDVRKVWVEHGGGIAQVDGTAVAFDPDRKQLTDADVADVAPALRRLGAFHVGLIGMPITDAALPHLRQVSSLKVLNLMGTHVTPAGVRQLRRMPRLREVGVDAAMFTAEDVRRLNADLPGVGVVRYVRVRNPYVGWHWVRADWVRADDGTAGEGGSKNENVSSPATGPSQ